jgi:hypothetical protein
MGSKLIFLNNKNRIDNESTQYCKIRTTEPLGRMVEVSEWNLHSISLKPFILAYAVLCPPGDHI